MDKIYLGKVVKMAIASSLGISLALVLNLDLFLSFFCPLMTFIVIWLLPDPIGLKRILLFKIIPPLAVMLFLGAFMVGLWGMNSIVLFIYVLLAGVLIKTLIPPIIRVAFMNMLIFFPMIVLVAPNPYTKAVNLWLLITMGFLLGWLVDRLFWPVFEQEGIKRQVSATFRMFEQISEKIFQNREFSLDDLTTLANRANSSMAKADKDLKTSAVTGSMNPAERDIWGQAIALQIRLLAHLLAISRLLQENKENPLLQELAPELRALADSLNSTFASLSVAVVSPQLRSQITNSNFQFQRWQDRLKDIRNGDINQSYSLGNRLAVALIEHRLQGMVKDLCQCLALLDKGSSNISADLVNSLELAP